MIDMTHATPELFAALSAAQERAKTVRKAGRNTHAGYDYSTAEDMILAARDARRETGLSLVTSWSYERTHDDPTGWATLTLSWVLMHASGGYISGEASIPAQSSKRNGADKCLMASLTYLEGFVERGMLRLDRGDVAPHEDRDSQDDAAEIERPAARPASNAEARRTAAQKKPDPARVRKGVATLHAQGKLTEDRIADAIRAIDGDEATVRGWIADLDAKHKPLGEPVFVDLGPLKALSEAKTADALLIAVIDNAPSLRLIDRKIVGAALLEHGQRLEVPIDSLDEALNV